MSSIKNLPIKFIFLLIVFFIFGYSFNYLINSKTNEKEINDYLENHPEEIEDFINIAEEMLITKRPGTAIKPTYWYKVIGKKTKKKT